MANQLPSSSDLLDPIQSELPKEPADRPHVQPRARNTVVTVTTYDPARHPYDQIAHVINAEMAIIPESVESYREKDETFRGLGIATVLKLLGIRWAAKNGFECIRTWSNTFNRPMLSLNEKLGSQKVSAELVFFRDL